MHTVTSAKKGKGGGGLCMTKTDGTPHMLRGTRAFSPPKSPSLLTGGPAPLLRPLTVALVEAQRLRPMGLRRRRRRRLAREGRRRAGDGRRRPRRRRLRSPGELAAREAAPPLAAAAAAVRLEQQTVRSAAPPPVPAAAAARGSGVGDARHLHPSGGRELRGSRLFLLLRREAPAAPSERVISARQRAHEPGPPLQRSRAASGPGGHLARGRGRVAMAAAAGLLRLSSRRPSRPE